MKFGKLIVAAVSLALAGLIASLAAQPKLVNKEEEAKEFAALQETEAHQDKVIHTAYTDNLEEMGFLVPMLKQDRAFRFAEEKDPLDFENTFRFVEITPRNSYIRYVKEDAQFLLNTFGTVQETLALVEEEVKEAQNANVKAEPLTFKERDGVELTQYNFIYDIVDGERRAIGSRRKSLTLFFEPNAEQSTPREPAYTLTMAVARVVEDNFRDGVRNIELIIDMTPQTAEMEDVIILHRYNQKPTNAIVLGGMHNTASYPHRLRFKQKFYRHYLDHFYRLYAMVANYASKGDNDYNEEVIENFEQSMDY